MHGRRLSEHHVTRGSSTATSSKDVFRLDPPQSFTYRDFVIRVPLPRLPHGMLADTAIRKYPRTRLKRLIRAVEARLGRHRCFFRECQPRDQKKESQFEVSRLYAIYEVEHWPGAFAQFDWTQFVMANIERDALRIECGRSVKLSLPILPASAVPIYQDMLRQESNDLARIVVNSGQVAGAVFRGQIRTYPEDDVPKQARHDGSDQQHGLVQTSFMPQLSLSPNMRDALSDLSTEQLEQLVCNDQMFRDACEFHQRVVQKELRQMSRLYLRCVGRQPGMNLLTWQEVIYEARKMIKMTFIEQLEKWRRRQPDVQFDFQDSTGTIADLQLRYLISRVQHHDPIPPQASRQFRTELHRKHQIAAMLRQRRILREWTTAIAKRSSVRDGERYRKEGISIMDMWTGGVEDYEAFDERNRKENTLLTAAMLPMATQLRLRTSGAQEQVQAGSCVPQESLDSAARPSQLEQGQGQEQDQDQDQDQDQEKDYVRLPPTVQAPEEPQIQAPLQTPTQPQGADHVQAQEGHVEERLKKTEKETQGQTPDHQPRDTEMTDIAPPGTHH
ncbi:hypothetical protein Z517_08577 [Fonsecaea pedrosoi CBS 271.37]|uniref:Uncharacterized protein n=1 Tax=Fonsecaea pedrosoi CBS 271.37 TaxID=1442368 RepID=A0A0D2GDA7_9EURO|nr:uncharacterized protein Z517_08577 [Fonsecaea pedrosoi CBS 271.37]KIW78738.1 hypothetical protein Z517_08577 [Fonsecaea pedrosoi CBS 271.37]